MVLSYTRSLELTDLAMTFDLSEVIERYASAMLALNFYYWLETIVWDLKFTLV